MTNTVIKYVLDRLYDLGIKDIFGVAGDYAFLLKTLFATANNSVGLVTVMN